MDDLISRQAAIELLRNMQTYKFFEGSDQLLVDQSAVMTELMLLPATQPERKTGKWDTHDVVKILASGKILDGFMHKEHHIHYLMNKHSAHHDSNDTLSKIAQKCCKRRSFAVDPQNICEPCIFTAVLSYVLLFP